MCGILGAIDRSFDTSLLRQIRHRGPDGLGIARMRAGVHQAVLGHCRLAIMDLSPSGHQPMSTDCGRYAITYNGEVYNHLELRKSLANQAFRGPCDTETILYCLARNGIGSVKRFNGIFAFGLVDSEHCKLFLARDPFGVKPLYYWGNAQGFVFSSEIRALRNLVNATVDPAALAEVLRLRYLPAPDTLLKGIHKVRPGHIVEVDLRSPELSLREYPYFDPEPVAAAQPSQAEAAEHYGFLLEQAVQRQLLSEVEVGVLLSGGIDSALVARFAQKHAPYRLKAFTVGFEESDEADEIAAATQTARTIGLDHSFVRVGLPDFLEILPRIASIVEEPLATASVVPMFYLSGLAAAHVKVVLSGQGADEVMGGYRRYQGELLRRYLPAGAIPLLSWAARVLRVRNDAVQRGLTSAREKDDLRRFLEVYTVFDADLIRYAEGLPCRYRRSLWRGKVLHKQFATRVLPDWVVHRKKNGFFTPTKRWFRQTSAIKEILLDSKSRFSTYFDRSAVMAVIDAHSKGMDRDRQIFLLLSLYYWMKEWLCAPEDAKQLQPVAMTLPAAPLLARSAGRL